MATRNPPDKMLLDAHRQPRMRRMPPRSPVRRCVRPEALLERVSTPVVCKATPSMSGRTVNGIAPPPARLRSGKRPTNQPGQALAIQPRDPECAPCRDHEPEQANIALPASRCRRDRDPSPHSLAAKPGSLPGDSRAVRGSAPGDSAGQTDRRDPTGHAQAGALTERISGDSSGFGIGRVQGHPDSTRNRDRRRDRQHRRDPRRCPRSRAAHLSS